jgi:hypothetical protein
MNYLLFYEYWISEEKFNKIKRYDLREGLRFALVPYVRDKTRNAQQFSILYINYNIINNGTLTLLLNYLEMELNEKYYCETARKLELDLTNK